MGGEETKCSTGGGLKMLKGCISFYDTSGGGNGTAVPPGFYPAADLALRHGGAAFRAELRALITSNLSLKAMDSQAAWQYFDKIFSRVNSAMAYRPFYYAYLLNTFQVHVDDNVNHVEIRALCGTGTLGETFDFGGKVYGGDEVIDTYRQALAEFQGKGNEGFTLRLIVSSLRVLDPEHIEADVADAVQLKFRNEDLVSGFDLVAEEDPNHRTLDYLDVWMELKQQEEKYNVELPLFFHDGESNDRNDTNIIDAVLLNSTRIGHGTNLYFYPYLFDIIKEQGTTLEVNPISNQVLRYVDNLELHPVNTFLAEGLNVAIAADDPGCFGYTGLTYDYWVSMVAFQLDLKAMKTLALNSLEFSSIYDEEVKAGVIGRWEKDWEGFIDDTLANIKAAKA